MTLPILYWANGSIPSWQVMCVLYEREITFEARRLRVMSVPKETRSPEFLAINPRGQTPTWVEPGGRVVTESMALMLYLDRATPGRALLPEEPGLMARALERIFQTGELRAAYRPLEQLFLGVEALSAPQLEAARSAPERVREELEVWEGYLEGGEFIAGDVFTLADCALYPVLAYQQRRGLVLRELPKLERYMASLAARPAIQRAQPEGWGGKRAKDLFAIARGL